MFRQCLDQQVVRGVPAVAFRGSFTDRGSASSLSESSSKLRKAAVIAFSSIGSKYQPASPPISGRAVESARATGRPWAIASTAGMPKLSHKRRKHQRGRLGINGAQGRALAIAWRTDQGMAADGGGRLAQQSGLASAPVPISTSARSPAATSGSRAAAWMSRTRFFRFWKLATERR